MTSTQSFPDRVHIKRALISVYDKRGVAELGAALQRLGVEIISSGGTFTALREAGVDARSVEALTGFGEMIGGRVKTLHPKIHAGILALRGVHDEELEAAGVPKIDLVVVNLYPFEEAIRRPDTDMAAALAQIDVGGPTMIRAAAKNFPHVAVVVDPDDYSTLLAEMEGESGHLPLSFRRLMALKAFDRTWRYDRAIAGHIAAAIEKDAALPPGPWSRGGVGAERLELVLEKTLDLRYGENPHQKAAFYRDAGSPASPLADAEKLHGKALSFNNILDMEGARLLVAEFEDPAAAIIKHSNPCGCAQGEVLREAYEKALATDPVSAFGGIVAFNRELDAETAAQLREIFLEVIIAPSFAPDAMAVLTRKKNLRLVTCPPAPPPRDAADRLDFRCVEGGFLLQEADTARMSEPPEWRVVTKRAPTAEENDALRFAWRVVKHVKSNAILFAGRDRTLAVGAGQMSRVDSVRLAVMKSQLPLEGSVLASDAFFPFRDGLDEAARAGVTAVIEPGGSVRDEEVIQAADEHDIAMVFTGQRHFRH